MPEEPTLTDNQPQIEVTDASANEEQLNAKIDQELGIQPKAAEPPKAEEPKPAEPPAVDDSATADGSDEEEQQPDSDSPETTEPEVKQAAEPATPSDEELFIEVVDADGVTHKISQIEDLPEDFTPKNNRHALEILRGIDKLDVQREQRAADAAEAEQKAFVKETQDAQFKSWDAEIAELAKSNEDIKDSEYVNDVFGYMNELNAARTKAKNPNLITSFEDALFRYQAKAAADKTEADKTNDNERAKLKSSIIGRSSTPNTGERYVYRAGSARNIDDVPL